MIVEPREQIALHPVSPADLGVAAAVHGGCFRERWDEKAIAELLTMPGSFGLLPMFEGLPAGLAIAYSLGAEGEILTLCILPDYRRRGFATRLLAAVLTRLAGQGCRRVLLEVAADNGAAHALYRNAGFAEIGRRAGYYRRDASRPVDAIILSSAIAAADVADSGSSRA